MKALSSLSRTHLPLHSTALAINLLQRRLLLHPHARLLLKQEPATLQQPFSVGWPLEHFVQRAEAWTDTTTSTTADTCAVDGGNATAATSRTSRRTNCTCCADVGAQGSQSVGLLPLLLQVFTHGLLQSPDVAQQHVVLRAERLVCCLKGPYASARKKESRW